MVKILKYFQHCREFFESYDLLWRPELREDIRGAFIQCMFLLYRNFALHNTFHTPNKYKHVTKKTLFYMLTVYNSKKKFECWTKFRKNFEKIIWRIFGESKFISHVHCKIWTEICQYFTDIKHVSYVVTIHFAKQKDLHELDHPLHNHFQTTKFLIYSMCINKLLQNYF